VASGVFLFLALGALSGGVSDRCQTLAENAGGGIEAASSTLVEAGAGLPSYCRVTGIIRPEIGFEARLPVDGWNGKYLQSGCGGFCGGVLADKEGLSNSINPALRRGYVVMTTDAGHQSAHIGVAEWAFHNDAAEKQYADESIKRAYKAGRSLTRAFYGKKARYSYFSGCSNGGRMAAIAAQRYPKLFDGIISGCPVLDLSHSGGVFGAWVLQANTDEKGDPVLTDSFAAKIPLLERAVLAACDGLDGADDRLIAAPQQCRVDDSAIPRCKVGSQSIDCLTEAEASVVDKWRRGPHDSKGEALFGGMPHGSERFWSVWYLGTREAPRVGSMLADGYLKYLGFEVDDPDRAAADFDFDRDPTSLAAKGGLFNATDPDLSAFRKAGGKLLMWHGLADPLVIPDQSVSYYRSVVELMGGDAIVQDFFRLFLAPGLGHCWEAPGAGPDDFDPLQSLENWVEEGIAPDEIIASPSDAQAGAVSLRIAFRPYPAAPVPRDLPE